MNKIQLREKFEQLRKYEVLKNAQLEKIQNLRQELGELRALVRKEYSPKKKYNQSSIELAIEALEKAEQTLKNRIINYTNAETAVIDIINLLTDPELVAILTYRYLQSYSFEQIIDVTFYSARSIYRKIDEAFEQLEVIMAEKLEII